LEKQMKFFVEKYSEYIRKFHFDVEVKNMLDAVKHVEGVELVDPQPGRYNFMVWIGKCFDIDTVVNEVIKVCQEKIGSDLSFCPVLTKNDLAELLSWVPDKT